jgi:hypothetical protein
MSGNKMRTKIKNQRNKIISKTNFLKLEEQISQKRKQYALRPRTKMNFRGNKNKYQGTK